MLLLNVPGAGEEAITSGTMSDGIQTKEASEVEEPMFHQLGIMEAMQKPGAVTASINWYRPASALLFATVTTPTSLTVTFAFVACDSWAHAPQPGMPCKHT